MSLKRTKAFLEHCSEAMPPGYPGGPGGDNAREALSEIRALERAASTLGMNGRLMAIEHNGFTDECEAVAVLKDIAEEAE